MSLNSKKILLLILLLLVPVESLIGSLVLTTPEPVTKGDIGLLDLKLKLRRDRERLEVGVRTGVNIGVLSEEWMLKLKTDMSVDSAGEDSFSEVVQNRVNVTILCHFRGTLESCRMRALSTPALRVIRPI